ncbi:MAG: DNA internalization-related competence protein ComEC/Rec2 [Rudaea sp.]
MRFLGDLRVADWLRPTSACALLAGAVVVQSFSALPSRWIDVIVAVVGIAIWITHRRLRLIAIVLVGIAWTAFRADITLSERLPHDLENEEIVVIGAVHDLPRALDDGTHFEFVVDRAIRDGHDIAFRGLVRIGWYETAPSIQPCERWHLHVKLKRPRGSINPGGFDFERFALERGIVATGSVRESSDNTLIDSSAWCVDRMRARIGETISAALSNGTSAGLLRALAFGDQHAMDEAEWNVARATGIPHLIAISGLHIALFAGFGVGLMRLFWKLAPRLTLRWPAPQMEAIASLVFAVAYAVIAGFGLPTRRALIMIGALLVANLMRRARAPVHGLALAVIILLIADPLCVLSSGFWLSFVGVGWLMFCLQGADSMRHSWKQLVRSQGVASLGLLPLGIWFFGQSSLIGPIANLVAVPVICFFVLPVGVVASLTALVFPSIGFPALVAVGKVLDVLWLVLQKLAQMPGALWYFPEPSLCAFALAMIGAFWLLQPRGIPARAIGAILFLPLLWPAKSALVDGAFEAYVLDVGQGLAIVVRTADHTLLYDAGPRYPSGFDMGEVAVVPALHALGIERIDRLIISHGDSDHAGGARAIANAFPGVTTESGEPERLTIPATQCRAGENWTWNGVTFRIVSPTSLESHGNDRCCVLDVRSGDNELVLTGDITSLIEADVAVSLRPIAAHLILQAPHHGSKTSSSAAFIDALKPTVGIFSAGYLNRFHHPNPDIVARYGEHRIETENTAESGFLRVRFGSDESPSIVERGRIDGHPYWRE